MDGSLIAGMALVLLVVVVMAIIRFTSRTSTEPLERSIEPLERDISDKDREEFHAKALKEAITSRPPEWQRKNRYGPTELEKEKNWGAQVWLPKVGYVKERADAEFEAEVDRIVPPSDREKAFYIKVVGVSHCNDNGTIRTRIIESCETFEHLILQHQPDNQFDSNAIAVMRETGEQIGYLDARLAGEVVRDCAKHGLHWSAIFRQPTHHPDTGKIVGAVIYMIRFSRDIRKETK